MRGRVTPEECSGYITLHGQPLGAFSKSHARYRRCVSIVQTRRDPDIACIGTYAIGHIKADPAQALNVDLCPGMCCILIHPIH